MSYRLPPELESELERYAEATRTSPDEALARLVKDGLREEVQKGGGWALIGLFSSPEDVELMEEVDRLVAESRGYTRRQSDES